MSGASERANGRARGPVLASGFFIFLAHSGASYFKNLFPSGASEEWLESRNALGPVLRNSESIGHVNNFNCVGRSCLFFFQKNGEKLPPFLFDWICHPLAVVDGWCFRIWSSLSMTSKTIRSKTYPRRWKNGDQKKKHAIIFHDGLDVLFLSLSLSLSLTLSLSLSSSVFHSHLTSHISSLSKVHLLLSPFIVYCPHKVHS